MPKKTLWDIFNEPRKTGAPLVTPPVALRQVWKYLGSNGTSVHVVLRDMKNQYTCTCQGFRIRKLGYCRHTEMAKNNVTSTA